MIFVFLIYFVGRIERFSIKNTRQSKMLRGGCVSTSPGIQSREICQWFLDFWSILSSESRDFRFQIPGEQKFKDVVAPFLKSWNPV